MADPNGFAMNAGELKATARYFDQIQRASDRLGRTRYQNIVKLNNELKFTARYFDQIYRTALKLSRLKLMPKVTLDDKASRDIDRLLAKLGQIRSKRIQVSADMKMPAVPAMPKARQKVEALPRIAQAAPAAPKVPQRVEPLPPIATGASKIIKDKPIAPKPDPAAQKPSIVQQQQSLKLSIINPAPSFPPIDFQPLVTALTINTDALVQLTSKLGNLQVGAAPAAEEKKKGAISMLVDGLKAGKTLNDGRLDVHNARAKSREIADEDNKRLQVNSDRALDDMANPSRTAQETAVLERERREEDEAYRIKRNTLKAERTGHRLGAGINLIEGGTASADFLKDFYGALTGSGGGEAKSSPAEAASQLIQGVNDSGILDTFGKGVAKKIFGPLGTLLEVGDAIRTTDDRARFEMLGGAAGGAIGGSAGAAIGTAVLPGLGTAVGGYLGGMAGDFVGEKVGGLVYEYGGKAAEFMDSTMDKLSSKMDELFSWGKKEQEKPAPKPSAPLSPTLAQAAGIPSPAMYGPMRDPAPPRFADPMDPIAMMNQRLISQAAPKVLPPAVPPLPAAPPAGIAGANAAGSGSQISVEMSQTQMGALSGMIQEAKTEVTNQVSINISPGTVQLDIHEEIDYAEIEGKIGAAIVAKVRQAFNNYKPTGGGSGGPSTAMAT